MALSLIVSLALAVACAAFVAVRRRPAGVRVGVDLVEVADVAAALGSPRARRYLDLVYTESEQRDAGLEPSRLAARFAAKEAAWKALGDGIGTLPWRSVEVVRGADGAPAIRLHGRARDVARKRGLREFAVSLTHEPGYAAAVVVATR